MPLIGGITGLILNNLGLGKKNMYKKKYMSMINRATTARSFNRCVKRRGLFQFDDPICF